MHRKSKTKKAKQKPKRPYDYVEFGIGNGERIKLIAKMAGGRMRLLGTDIRGGIKRRLHVPRRGLKLHFGRRGNAFKVLRSLKKKGEKIKVLRLDFMVRGFASSGGCGAGRFYRALKEAMPLLEKGALVVVEDRSMDVRNIKLLASNAGLKFINKRKVEEHEVLTATERIVFRKGKIEKDEKPVLLTFRKTS